MQCAIPSKIREMIRILEITVFKLTSGFIGVRVVGVKLGSA